jgi:predicted enzyme related to lactoylglutathione lyase
MQVTSFNININSAQPQVLIDWYANVLGLETNDQLGDGAFNVAGGHIHIDGHTEIQGPTSEPARILVNLFVDDLAAERTRLQSQGVEFIRDPEREAWGGLITTFVDPDGNYLQLLEFNP